MPPRVHLVLRHHRYNSTLLGSFHLKARDANISVFSTLCPQAYVPPLAPPPIAIVASVTELKHSAPEDGTSSLLSGELDEADNARWFQEARRQWLLSIGAAVDPATSKPIPFIPAAGVSAVSSSDSQPTSQSAWWEGTPDEEANSNAFQAAREEFLRSVTSSGEKQTTINTTAHESAASSTEAVGGLPWWAGEIDEAENQRAFQQARSSFLGSQPQPRVSPPASFALPVTSAENLDLWNASIAQQQPSSLFASSLFLSRSPTPLIASQSSQSQAARAAPQPKTSCYHCFRLFVSAAEEFSSPLPLDATAVKVASFCSSECKSIHNAEVARKQQRAEQMMTALMAATEQEATLAEAPVNSKEFSEAKTSGFDSNIPQALASTESSMIASSTQEASPPQPIVTLPDDDDDNVDS